MSRVTGHVKTVSRKRGDVYYLKYRLNDGRQIQKLLGPKWAERGRPPVGYYTDKTANEALQELLADARRGTLAGHAPRTGKTFADATAEWLRVGEHDKQLASTTVNDYRSVARLLEAEFGADTPLEKITTDRIEVYRDRLLADDRLTRRTVQKHLIAMHGILKRAKRRKWIAANPAEDVERVKVNASGDFNVLTPVEVFAVARAEPVHAALFTFAAFTGLRMGELRSLRWLDVDFAASTIHVRRNQPTHAEEEKAPKSGKIRSVPLIDQAAVALDALSRRERFTAPIDRVFGDAVGEPFDDVEVRDAFYAALKTAGLGGMRERDEPIVFHDLRHTFGTLMASLGESVVDIQSWMGHADLKTTQRYMHHVPKTGVAERLSRAVDAALNGDVSRTVSRTDDNGATRTETGAAL